MVSKIVLSALLMSLSFASNLFATDVSITTTVIKVVPAAGQTEAPAWASGTTYAQGTYTKRGGQVYMCLVAPGVASTNAPSGGITVTTAEGYTWRRCLSRARSGLVLSNAGSINLRFAHESSEVSSSTGAPLNASGGAMTYPSPIYQGEIFAAAESGTNTLSFIEW